jgi:tetratricopeptide (TPR) repeat protein
VIDDFGFPNIDTYNDNQAKDMQLMLNHCYTLKKRIDKDSEMQNDPFYAAMDFNDLSLDSALMHAIETGRILPATYLKIVNYNNYNTIAGGISVILDFETETTSLMLRSPYFNDIEDNDSMLNTLKQTRAQHGFFPVDERTSDLLKTTWYSKYPYKEIKQNWSNCNTCKNSDFDKIKRDAENIVLQQFNKENRTGFNLVIANAYLSSEQKNVHKFNPSIQRKADETADNNAINYYIKNYQYENALNLLSNIANKSDDMLRQEASLLSTLKRHEEAIDVYTILYRKDSTNIRTMTDMASVYESLGNFADAQGLLMSAYSADTTNVVLQQRIGDSYFQSENYKLANSFYFKAESMHSVHYLVRQIARCYEKMEQDSLATIYYQKAIDYNPKDYASTIKVSNSYIGKKDFVNALKTVKNYFQLDSLNLPIIENYAAIYLLTANYDKAISLYMRYLGIAKTAKPLIIKNLGYCYLGKKEYENAISYLTAAFMFESKNPELSFKLGLAFQGNNEYDNAEIFFDETLKNLTPDSIFVSQIHHSLSEVAMAKNNYKLSIEELKKVYEQNPEDNISLYEIAVIYDLQLNDKRNASVYYQKFLTSRNVSFDESAKNQYGNKIELYKFAEKWIEIFKMEK